MAGPKKSNMMNRNDLSRSKFHRDFRDKQIRVLAENSEFAEGKDGELIGKAPNNKRIRDFYKKLDRHLRVHGRNGKKRR